MSGLALGIDGEGHAATLRTGTIALFGGAVDHIYPPQHERLYAEIAAESLLVSESPIGYRAKAQDFPRRNRIITGIARGTVVVQAAERSGSLISARMAGEQGREVMTVPGSPLDPRAAGANGHIYQGTSLVRHAVDVVEILSSIRFGHVSSPETPPFDPESHDAPCLTARSPRCERRCRPTQRGALRCNACRTGIIRPGCHAAGRARCTRRLNLACVAKTPRNKGKCRHQPPMAGRSGPSPLSLQSDL